MLLLAKSRGELEEGDEMSDEFGQLSFPILPMLSFFKSVNRLSDTSVVFAMLLLLLLL